MTFASWPDALRPNLATAARQTRRVFLEGHRRSAKVNDIAANMHFGAVNARFPTVSLPPSTAASSYGVYSGGGARKRPPAYGFQ